MAGRKPCGHRLTGQKESRQDMNPMNFMKAKGLLTQFTTNHPKLPAFFRAASKVIGEGTVLELTVTTAEGKTLCTNMKVKPEDMQLVQELKNLSK